METIINFMFSFIYNSAYIYKRKQNGCRSEDQNTFCQKVMKF